MKSHLTFWICLFLLAISNTLSAQDKMKIKDVNGNVLLEARVDGVLIRKMTTAERTAVAGLTAADNGLMVYDTDTKSLWLWHDTAWSQIDGVDMVDDADHDPQNETNTSLSLNGTVLELTDSGGTKSADLNSLKNDADADPQNETNTSLSLNGTVLELTDSGGTKSADLTSLVNDADADPQNETNTSLSLNGTVLELTDSGGTKSADLNSLKNDADADPQNETNTSLSLNGTVLELTDNGGTKSADLTSLVNDADADPQNETNTSLSLNGTVLELTDNGGTKSADLSSLMDDDDWTVEPGKVYNTSPNVGIGTSVPQAKLNVQNGAVLFDGAAGPTPVSGAGARLMWVPGKQAFRAGFVNSTQWDDANIGPRSSVGGGTDNIASGQNSFVGGGNLNTASGFSSFVSGRENSASGINAMTGGGFSNSATGVRSFVGGGDDNTSSESDAFVGGGVSNIASGASSFVGGGLSNIASGYASFVSGRENIASGNHSFASGYGLLAKSFDETVFGTYNADYTPASATGIVSTDRLFVIGNGANSSARSNAMTVLKSGNVGFGTSDPKAGVHVVGDKDSSDHIMLIENLNPHGNGLRIKIDGSHPLFVLEPGVDSFFVTHPFSGLDSIFNPVADSIRSFLTSGGLLNLSSVHLSNIASPGGLFDQLGLVDFVSGGVCKGVQTLVDLANTTLLSPIQLPNLPLDGIPADVPNIPNMPVIPSVPDITITTPSITIDPPVIGTFTFNPPNLPLNTDFINNAFAPFNTAIGTVNSGIATTNNGIESGYDFLRNGLTALDNLAIDLPDLQMPDHIGPITCPNPNPWDAVTFQFQSLNPNDYNILNPLSSDNAFITFSDKYDNKLGAITAQSMGEFSKNYFSKEKVLEIGSYVTGMLSADGGVVKNLMKLGKEAIAFYKATDDMGVLYSSGHGDYAEWLERENHNENIGYGDIVGIRGGKISLSVENAEQVMVVSKAPIVLGNIPDESNEKNGNNVAFIGQVPVKVMGPVQTGDFIIANPETPGFGIAVPEKEITPQQFALAIGKSWETNSSPGFKFVNAIVGMHNNSWAVPVMKLEQQLNDQNNAIQSLTARLDKLENEGLVADSKSPKH